MHAKTAVAVAGSVLALPSIAVAADVNDPVSPELEAVRAPLAGHLTVRAQMLAAKRAADTERLLKAHLRLARRAARLSGDQLPHGYRSRLRGASPSELRKRNERLRARIRGLRKHREIGSPAGAGGSTASSTLQAIAACESGGNPSTNTGNGFYGKYQFTMSTWQAVGGSGSPAAASEAEQDKRAAQLYATAGAGQWPVCGR